MQRKRERCYDNATLLLINERKTENDTNETEHDNILLSIQKNRTNKYIAIQKVNSVKIEENVREKDIEKKPKYPIEFTKLPIWKKLCQIIFDKLNAPRNLVLLFVNCELKDYSPICAFVYYYENLDKSLRINLIKGMIEVLNNYINLYNKKKLIWNNKNVSVAINLMKNWKLQLFLDSFIKEK